MIVDYKVCVVISAGRKNMLELLLEQLKKELNIVDEIHFWLNTLNKDDINYMNEIVKTNPTLFKIDLRCDYTDPNFFHPSWGHMYSLTASYFYSLCTDENTVYVKFDDDISFIEDGYIEDIAKFTIHNNEYMMVLGNVINNAVCDYNHIKYGNISYNAEIKETCFCENGWKNPIVAETKHRVAIDNIKNNNLDSYRFPSKEWTERFSLNSIAWLGENFKKFDGIVDGDDEHLLTTCVKDVYNSKNIIYGNKVCVHYSFNKQILHIEKTDILEQYKKLI